MICPGFFRSQLGAGPALKALCAHAEDVGEKHFAIFSPFPSMFDIIAGYIRNLGFAEPFLIKGGMDPKEVTPLIKEAEKKQRILLISTQFAEGFSAPSCSYGYFLGYDYSPVVNLQAEDRIHRVNSPGPVTISYMKVIDSIDEDILDILNTKNKEIYNALEGGELSEMSLQALLRKVRRRQGLRQ